MKQYYSYIRVSTTRQGERGVSLPEQRDAIERYAARNNFQIIQLFEEQQTAAKKGRPVWNGMLKLLRHHKAAGVIIHKIDRSARNLRDWADLGEMIDQGIEVHFVNESLDLHSRGGRLSADIQAVVAADYIRNLREESIKGLYGRLKQGYYPWRAPIGYLDRGAAKAKTIDPVRGPLIRAAFDLYAEGKWSIPTLVDELYRRGLRNLGGGRVSRNGLHTILRNPFYTGIIHIRVTNRTFAGNHESLVSKGTFDLVQGILHGRVGARIHVHDFLFRKYLKCGLCGYSLIGEQQKGIIYYRCHSRTCPRTNIREDAAERIVVYELKKLELSEEEQGLARETLAELQGNWAGHRANLIHGLELKVVQATDRLSRLTDAYLDQTLDRDAFEERKAALIRERRALEDTLRDYQGNKRSDPEELEKCIELAQSAYSLYKNADRQRKRELLRIVTSNCVVRSKTLDFTFTTPFREIAGREKSDDGRASREIARTLDEILKQLNSSPSASAPPSVAYTKLDQMQSGII